MLNRIKWEDSVKQKNKRCKYAVLSITMETKVINLYPGVLICALVCVLQRQKVELKHRVNVKLTRAR